MIRSFADKNTEKLYTTGHCQKYGNIEHAALRKLGMLDAAAALNDLKVPPGNHLELLQGDRIGQYSIRINDQYRICFFWDSGNAVSVEICDYH